MFTKVVLGIFIRPATVSDGMAWTLDTTVATLLAKSFYLLGDAAFNGYPEIIAPFRTEDINQMERVNPAMAAVMRYFNTAHSSNRMSSEHVVGLLKNWAVIRGTSKAKMFLSEQAFTNAVNAVWSLVNISQSNYLSDDKPFRMYYSSDL